MYEVDDMTPQRFDYVEVQDERHWMATTGQLGTIMGRSTFGTWMVRFSNLGDQYSHIYTHELRPVRLQDGRTVWGFRTGNGAWDHFDEAGPQRS